VAWSRKVGNVRLGAIMRKTEPGTPSSGGSGVQPNAWFKSMGRTAHESNRVRVDEADLRAKCAE
jgi:hypothetical protein